MYFQELNSLSEKVIMNELQLRKLCVDFLSLKQLQLLHPLKHRKQRFYRDQYQV